MATGTHCPVRANSAGSATAAVWAAVPEPKTIPPEVGRMNVWMESLTESRAGILSATISTASSTATIASTQPFSSQAQPDGRWIRPVYLPSRPIDSSGM